MGRELPGCTCASLGVVDVLDIAPDVLACAWLGGHELHVVDGDGRGLFIAVEELAAASTDARSCSRGGRRAALGHDLGELARGARRQTTVDDDGMLSRPR